MTLASLRPAYSPFLVLQPFLAKLKMVEGEGFEPSKASPTDLQSVPFGHSGTPPNYTNQVSPDYDQLYLHQDGVFFYVFTWMLILSSTLKKIAFIAQARKIIKQKKWSWRWDSNPQPADYKSAALPIELRQQSRNKLIARVIKINHFLR